VGSVMLGAGGRCGLASGETAARPEQSVARGGPAGP
jgi:hypothetical protein